MSSQGRTFILDSDQPDSVSHAIARKEEQSDWEYLVYVTQQLSRVRTLPAIMSIVRRAARNLARADGATFVLRDNDQCFYAEEDAIGPLWKGKRFPMDACISGWAMRNGQPVIIPDIFEDDRIPLDAYRSTFVKSLLMVPIGGNPALGAIGNYWAEPRIPTLKEATLLSALADITYVVMENGRLYEQLEQSVRVRTAELEAATKALAAYLSAPSARICVRT